MPKLQVALDDITLTDALSLIGQLGPNADIIEAGTPFVLRYGIEAVRELKKRYPAYEMLCDGKIMDAGAYEAECMFQAGADWVTVMAVTDDATVADCVATATRLGGRVMADMLCVTDMENRARRLEALGVHCIAVHTGVDQQRLGRTALEDLRRLKNCVTRCMVAVAGGITAQTADAYLKLKPDILIVGGGILGQPHPAEAAAALYGKISAGADAL